MMNETTIIQAYERLARANEHLFTAHGDVVTAQLAYDDARAGILATTAPKELGPNEDAREAKLREVLHAQLAALRAAQARERAMRFNYEQARTQVDSIKALLAFMSTGVVQTFNAQTNGNGHQAEVDPEEVPF